MMKNIWNSQRKSTEELEQFLEENSCRTQSELAQELGVTRHAISKRLHKLGRIQKEGHWVLHELTRELTENKRRWYCYDIAVSLLSRVASKRRIFCTKLICDEKWILYNNPKRRISTPRRCCCIYSGISRVSFINELLQPDETVTAQRYQ